MGNCGGHTVLTDEEKKRQQAIDAQLRATKKKYENEVKLLLLGAGESGKSTIIKQMKIIHQEGFSDAERRGFRETIHSNVIVSIRAVLEARSKLGFTLTPEQVPLSNQLLGDCPAPELPTLTPELAGKIKLLLEDPGIIQTIANSNQYQLGDSSVYYFTAIERLASPDFVPTDEDILRVRVKTTGVKEAVFQTEGVTFRMVDVGGQRSERKKWIHCFDGVRAILFCVGLSEYDQKLFEDESVNRMFEALRLFDDVCNSKWFKKTSVILFLNKDDLFKEKLARGVDLKVCFPDYTGGCEYKVAVEFVTEKFRALDKHMPDREIFVHRTCATDTNNIKTVFEDVRSIVLMQALDDIKF
eukprot:TRINITY_DN2690_c1_g2_i1.p1 TRINITY_DN2690_c1_g2~~TRINITY_DN2690_c1_g2_i1.p1  ORF type:complete len:367 (-),score=81.22 TRINITY_DN2690_c1_g2_i1:110-1177(-)